MGPHAESITNNAIDVKVFCGILDAMDFLWTTILYNPLLNALIALYNGPAGQNLGLAIVELVVIIRIFLLPITIISERARIRYDRLQPQIYQIDQSFKNDPVARKQAIRKLLVRHHIKPWAKAVVLGILFVIIIILYWVFLIAVRENNFTGLYAWNQAPDFLNTNFLGFDLKGKSLIWAGMVAGLLYLNIWFDQRKHRTALTRGDLIYRLFFPATTLLVLFLLPMAKSLFILTSMVVSVIIGGVRRIFVKTPETGVGPFKPAVE